MARLMHYASLIPAVGSGNGTLLAPAKLMPDKWHTSCYLQDPYQLGNRDYLLRTGPPVWLATEVCPSPVLRTGDRGQGRILVGVRLCSYAVADRHLAVASG